MKIREGFVSNSSSASYIVKIKGTNFNGLVEELFENGFWIDPYVGAMAEQIDRIEELNADMPSKFPLMDSWRKEQAQKDQDLLTEFKKANESADTFEKVRILFKYYGITFEETSNDIILTYFTSMHNDFNSGMADLLKEIVLSLTFRPTISKPDIECIIEQD